MALFTGSTQDRIYQHLVVPFWGVHWHWGLEKLRLVPAFLSWPRSWRAFQGPMSSTSNAKHAALSEQFKITILRYRWPHYRNSLFWGISNNGTVSYVNNLITSNKNILEGTNHL
jgi:hypothetical protein